MFEALNTYRSTVREGIDTSYMEFAGLNEFVGHEFVVDGFFFNDSKFGKQVVVVGEGYLINMPKRAVKVFEQVENDEEMLQAMLAGKMGIKDIKPIDTKSGESTAYTFFDVE